MKKDEISSFRIPSKKRKHNHHQTLRRCQNYKLVQLHISPTQNEEGEGIEFLICIFIEPNIILFEL